ncbi:unnamed protein product [Cyclocybe aegerita]|uniref:Uncharacterized protein n=1 Tax=Cyclocybe aegerita TaxID=1973307 RepID=A0A8S0VRZ0_CYCAE|nr:unnamed protein product [Cyclocybe aegerita]
MSFDGQVHLPRVPSPTPSVVPFHSPTSSALVAQIPTFQSTAVEFRSSYLLGRTQKTARFNSRPFSQRLRAIPLLKETSRQDLFPGSTDDSKAPKRYEKSRNYQIVPATTSSTTAEAQAVVQQAVANIRDKDEGLEYDTIQRLTDATVAGRKLPPHRRL